jgi:hypothetical protein
MARSISMTLSGLTFSISTGMWNIVGGTYKNVRMQVQSTAGYSPSYVTFATLPDIPDGNSATYTMTTAQMENLFGTYAPTGLTIYFQLIATPVGPLGGTYDDVITTESMHLPDSYVPSPPTNLTATRVDNGVPPAWNVWVFEKTKVRLTWNASSGAAGSSITEYPYSLASTGAPLGSISSPAERGPFATQTPATITFYVWAKDSRGRESSRASVSVTFINYTPPTITSTTVERCDASGNSANLGTYAKIKLVYGYDSVGGKNSAAATYAVNSGGGSWSAESAIANNTALVVGGSYNTATAYNFRFTVTDGAGSTAVATKVLNPLKSALRFAAGGTRLYVTCPTDFSDTINAPNFSVGAGQVIYASSASYTTGTVGATVKSIDQHVNTLDSYANQWFQQLDSRLKALGG